MLMAGLSSFLTRSVAERLTTQIVEIDVAPSGTRIAYQHRLRQPTRYIVVVDGKAVYQCKTGSRGCVPQWLDDRSLVILDAGSDEKALVVVNADSGEVRGRYRWDPPQ